MLPGSSVISAPLLVVVELGSSVLLVLRQLKSVASTASEFTFASPASSRTPTDKVRRAASMDNGGVRLTVGMFITRENNTPYQVNCIC